MSETNPPQKIVVALDGSRISQNAADVAIQIARAEAHLVEGLYIVDEPLILDPYTDYGKELGSDRGKASRAKQIEWFDERGSAVVDQFQEHCFAQGISVRTRVLLGGVPKMILENTNQISFLALGRRGNSHADDPHHLGENFRYIAHHAQVPLIVGGDETTTLKQLFLIYDGSEKGDLALKMTIGLQKTLAAQVTVGLTGHSYLDDDPDSLLFRLSGGGIARDHIVDLRSKPMRKVVDVIAEKHSDLIIMGGYRHPEIMEWLVGSPNDQILRQIPLPAIIA